VIQKLLVEFLKKRGYTLKKTILIERLTMFFFRVLDEERNKETKVGVACIVFSKDRAMQLNAFIESYFDMVDNPGILYVLYTCSTEKALNSYEEIKTLNKNNNVVFVEQSEFRGDLIALIDQIKVRTIGLFVDDIVFVNKIDSQQISHIDTFRFILSLSRGKDLDFCVPLSKKMHLPTFHESVYGFNTFYWDEFDELNDWTFPLGISGYFYGNSELKVMLTNISFNSPNTLELGLSCYYPLFAKRIGLCTESILCPCIHANIVQTDHDNPEIGTHSVEELLEKWESGYKIDLRKFYFKKGSDVQFSSFDFIKR